ncbi:hypothetical protein PSAC2689_200056 [Paraburkholderia sacchari]
MSTLIKGFKDAQCYPGARLAHPLRTWISALDENVPAVPPVLPKNNLTINKRHFDTD